MILHLADGSGPSCWTISLHAQMIMVAAFEWHVTRTPPPRPTGGAGGCGVAHSSRLAFSACPAVVVPDDKRCNSGYVVASAFLRSQARNG
jgi:hypothetical protein